MNNLKPIGMMLGFLASALTTTALLIPDSAEAADALFRSQRIFYAQYGTYTYTMPSTMAKTYYVAHVGTTMPAPKVTLDKSWLGYYSYYYCNTIPGGMCFYGYPVSGGFFDYELGEARFRPNNPNGPAATPSLVFFETTMSKSPTMYATTQYGATNKWIPKGTFSPVTPTTTFTGKFDFSKAGYINISAGPNKFGGTMRFIYGDKASFYQLITISQPFITKAYGTFTTTRTTMVESMIGDFDTSGMMRRYRMTAYGGYKATTGGAKYGSKTAGGPFIFKNAYYLHQNGIWTTGMVSGYQPLNTFFTRRTETGYDNRTPIGLKGVLSLVRPRLTHTYLLSSDPNDPIINNFSALRVSRLSLEFFPEPGALVMLGGGLMLLAGMAYLRRR